jgi:predicted house-cleaning noncanonical NTP pyrophosphatase (MazG superfamily)
MTKLIRDKIPAITQDKGLKLKFRKLTKAEFKLALAAKLVEEAKEYQESFELDELADVLEVLCAILKENKTSWNKLAAVRKKKAKARGAFAKRLSLINA